MQAANHPTPAEEWRTIPDFDGYEVSNIGRVRNAKRVLKLQTDERGRKRAYVAGKQRRAHVLVMAAFIGPRPEGMSIRHLNGNPSDNRVENLAYGTHGENMYDSVLHGTHNSARKTHCKRGHEFTDENTRWLPPREGINPRRQCRECTRMWARTYAARNRERAAA